MRGKRICAAVLACLLLTGCGGRPTEPLAEEPVPEEALPIAYVPLDDRPDNVERVEYLAESLGYTLEMPDLDLYRTRLNGQPLNENGTQSGDRGTLYEWVLAQEAAGCDRYILSMDQLLSGGLVNSRAMSEHEDVVLSDGGALTEFQLLENLLSTLAADENNQVWLLDSVMRLAPTVGYRDWTLEDYNALRSYGAESRPELTGAALTLDSIEANYRLGANGLPLSCDLEESRLTEYLSARGRKLELADDMLETATALGADNIRVLIGIDDSSVENSIQKNEIAYLTSCLRDGDALLSGVDDLAFKAVTKLYLNETDWQGAAAAVRYYGGTEDQPACEYDYKPLTEIMAEHLDFFGVTRSGDGAAADMQILVLTQPMDVEQTTAYYEALIGDLQACRKAGQPVVLMDAGNGVYGTAFHDALTKETELGYLLSYSGFLDMAIVTGTALSHGVARYAFLQSGQAAETTERAFARTLADSVLKDFCYKNVVRDDLLAYIRNDLGGDPNNFYLPDIDRAAILSRLESGMEKSTTAVIKNLEQSSFISSLDPYEETGWGGIALENYRFPWDRAFEIGMDIKLGEFTEPR
jgi:hypothetical protein